MRSSFCVALLAALSGCGVEQETLPSEGLEGSEVASDGDRNLRGDEGVGIDGEEFRFHELINEYRASHGLVPLTLSPTLTRGAVCRSREMAERNYFSHTSYECADNAQIYFARNPSAGRFGENIAVGFNGAESVFQGWRNSPGHDANMREGRYRTHAIRRWLGSDGRWRWTSLFGDVSDADGSVRFRCGQVRRLAGPNRYATAAAVSRDLFPWGAPVVVLASGNDNAPDALAAGPLARAVGGPLLTTVTDGLPAEIADEIGRLGARRALLIGGVTAIGGTVAQQLAQLGLSVERIAGATRWATAALVAARVGGGGGFAFVASGENGRLIDALAASGPAAAVRAPILLVHSGGVPDETRQALQSLGITRTLVIGGAAAIPDAVISALPSPRRIAGPDRYSTAAALADEALGLGVSPSSVFVARGDRTPDALAAGAAGRIILLSPSSALATPAEAFINAHAQSTALLGGDVALGADVESATCRSLQ